MRGHTALMASYKQMTIPSFLSHFLFPHSSSLPDSWRHASGRPRWQLLARLSPWHRALLHPLPLPPLLSPSHSLSLFISSLNPRIHWFILAPLFSLSLPWLLFPLSHLFLTLFISSLNPLSLSLSYLLFPPSYLSLGLSLWSLYSVSLTCSHTPFLTPFSSHLSLTSSSDLPPHPYTYRLITYFPLSHTPLHYHFHLPLTPSSILFPHCLNLSFLTSLSPSLLHSHSHLSHSLYLSLIIYLTA